MLSWTPSDILDQYPHLWANFTLYIGVNGTSETHEKWLYHELETRHQVYLKLLSTDVIKINNPNPGADPQDIMVVQPVHPNGTGIQHRPTSLYVNGTFYKSYNTTFCNGITYLQYDFNTTGLYYFVGIHEGNKTWARSNETSCVAVVLQDYASVRLEVTPSTFKDGDEIALQVHVTNMSSYSDWSGAQVQFFKWYADNTTTDIDSVTTNASGWAVLNHIYNSSNGLYAFNVSIVDNGRRNITATNYPTFTVASETRLLLDVQKENTTNKHLLSGKLISDSSGVAGKTITISVNGTLVKAIATDENGEFNLELDLLTEEQRNSTSYNFEAIFDGDTPQNVTSYMQTVNGTQPFCTVTYFGYQPAANATTLTVSPQSTDVATPTKTPEEMQHEAEDSGWLTVWHEFTWLYPWYRLHVQIDVNPRIHVAFNPLLPGGETWFWQGLEIFAAIEEEFIQELVLDLVLLFGEYVAAKFLSMLPITWLGAAITMIVKGITQTVLLVKDWYDSTRMLAAALVNFILGIMAFKASIGVAFINALFNLVYGRTMSSLYLLQGKLVGAAEPIQHIRIWVDEVEILMDFAINISALVRYLDLTGAF